MCEDVCEGNKWIQGQLSLSQCRTDQPDRNSYMLQSYNYVRYHTNHTEKSELP